MFWSVGFPRLYPSYIWAFTSDPILGREQLQVAVEILNPKPLYIKMAELFEPVHLENSNGANRRTLRRPLLLPVLPTVNVADVGRRRS